MRRAFIFGISGATWQIIDSMLARGKLPTFRRLIEGGCRGVLESVRVDGDKHFRPQIAWPTIATGLLPKRHGVTKFYHTADDVSVPTIWDLVQQQSGRVGLFGWPITW